MVRHSSQIRQQEIVMLTKNSSFIRTVCFIGVLFLVWRIALFSLSAISDSLVSYAPSFPYSTTLLPKYDLPRWLYSWAGFDGVHYLTIAEKGYIGTGLVQAFFPLLPFVLLYLPKVFLGGYNTLLIGLSLTNFCSLLLGVMWYFFVREERGSGAARWSLATLFLFPTAFFFGALYTESLFLCLVLAVFWLARSKHWAWASLFLGLAAMTRVVGILLLPAVIVELIVQGLSQVRRSKNETFLSRLKRVLLLPGTVRNLFIFSLSTLGLAAYMIFLWREFGDPLYFAHVQSAFNSGRQNDLVLYPQVVWRSIKILFTSPMDFRYATSFMEALVGIGGLIALIITSRKTRLCYTVFAISAFLVPPLTGTFTSLPRYFLVSLPFFFCLGEYFSRHRKIGLAYLLCSTLWLGFNTILFLQGLWVA